MRTPITHPLNVSYLVVGLVFMGISASWALRAADIVDNRDVGWLLPLILVAAGVVGLAAFATRGFTHVRAGNDPDSDGYDDDAIWHDTTEGDLR